LKGDLKRKDELARRKQEEIKTMQRKQRFLDGKKSNASK
jgi:hypothetical protein